MKWTVCQWNAAAWKYGLNDGACLATCIRSLQFHLQCDCVLFFADFIFLLNCVTYLTTSDALVCRGKLICLFYMTYLRIETSKKLLNGLLCYLQMYIFFTLFKLRSYTFVHYYCFILLIPFLFRSLLNF